MRVALALAGACLCVVSCVSPGTEVTYTDPKTGEVVTTTTGDIAADQIEATGSVWAGIAGKALGVATGNPIVGLTSGALITALLGTAAAGLRPKKKLPVVTQSTE